MAATYWGHLRRMRAEYGADLARAADLYAAAAAAGGLAPDGPLAKLACVPAILKRLAQEPTDPGAAARVVTRADVASILRMDGDLRAFCGRLRAMLDRRAKKAAAAAAAANSGAAAAPSPSDGAAPTPPFAPTVDGGDSGDVVSDVDDAVVRLAAALVRAPAPAAAAAAAAALAAAAGPVPPPPPPDHAAAVAAATPVRGGDDALPSARGAVCVVGVADARPASARPPSPLRGAGGGGR